NLAVLLISIHQNKISSVSRVILLKKKYKKQIQVN
ncbi:translation initiation factor IF-2, conserved domain family protein, partial [Chlamydia psittaci 08-2626_L3]